MKIKAIVFDKDGTLIDFTQTFDPATVQVIDHLSQGDKSLALEIAHALQFDLKNAATLPGSLIIAGSGEDFAKALMPVLKFDDLSAFSADIDKLYGKICVETVEALPGIEDALLSLKAQNYVLAISTNDAEANARSQMEKLKFDKWFSHILGADSGYGPKPGAGMINAFIEKTGIAREHILMVGDSLHDLEAGKSAGVWICGVETGPASRDELVPHADFVVTSVSDLPKFLQH